jgi:hypothetical protein
MIKLMVASAILAAAFQSAAADNARTALRTCIKTAATDAKTQKIGVDAFPAFVRDKCTVQATTFKSAVWAFDSKNKVSKKQSESDVNLQIDDFVTAAEERYQLENAP